MIAMYDMGDQFKPDYRILKPNTKSVIAGNNYRFTVLSERLIRLEYNPKGAFYDGATRLVSSRAFPETVFQVRQDEKYLEIVTGYFKLEYQKERAFDAGRVMPVNNLKVTLLSNGNYWYYGHPEVRNYQGPIGSYDVDPKFKKGLFSLDGFVALDDSKDEMINLDGTIAPREQYTDIYLFMYGDDFEGCLEDYFKLTGKPPLIPRYALGNWWCRNTNYTTEDILKVANEFEKRDIPLAVFLLDKDWHIREINENGKKRNLFTGYTFNKFLIPNPDEMIKKLHDKNIRVGLQVNPKEGLYPHEEFYEQAIKYLGIENGKPIHLDYKDPKNIDVYLKMFVHPLETKGVDFFWNDYDVADPDQYPLWVLNHYHFLDLSRNKAKRGMLLGRNAGVATHRYPVCYTGKTEITWESLKKIPWLNETAANAGVSWISTDVGGNHGGVEESELYIRSVELGVFSPILRFHAARGKYYKKEPWRWDAKTVAITEKYLRLRHRLLPYLYTEAYNYYEKGVPIVQPLYYKLPWVYDDESYRNEYYFGRELLVAPIITKKDSVMNRTTHRFYIPEGMWYDYNTGKTFIGNKKYVSFFKEDDYPVFVRSGAIIPLSNKSNLNNVGNPSDMEIQIFPGQSNSYVLYEDDGVTSLYKEGYFLKTSIEFNYTPSNYTVIIKSLEGKKGIVPDMRNYKFRFRNTKLADSITALFNNSQKSTNVYLDDNDLIVELKDIPSVGQLVLNVKGKDIEISAVRLINDDIDSILMDLKINTFIKERISSIVFSNLPISKKRIEIRKLRRDGLSKDHTKLFLKLLDYIGEI